MMAEATMMSLDELTSRIRLLLDLNRQRISEMTATVDDPLSVDYSPIQEVRIRGWNDSPMKLLEIVWDYVAWPGGRTLCTLRGDDSLPGMRIRLQGEDEHEGPTFVDIAIRVCLR